MAAKIQSLLNCCRNIGIGSFRDIVETIFAEHTVCITRKFIYGSSGLKAEMFENFKISLFA